MKSFAEICVEVGYNPYAQQPIKQNVWYAYKQGESFKFDSYESAIACSSNVERVFQNSENIKNPT